MEISGIFTYIHRVNNLILSTIAEIIGNIVALFGKTRDTNIIAANTLLKHIVQ